jgi:class 3 adenylate cyclase
VLFADVVYSMDIAAAVGAERLREIMSDLADHCPAVVHRYGGTVGSFTGDGIMAVFGAPVALEDHAIRACLTTTWFLGFSMRWYTAWATSLVSMFLMRAEPSGAWNR